MTSQRLGDSLDNAHDNFLRPQLSHGSFHHKVNNEKPEKNLREHA